METWYKIICDQCDSVNWVCDGDTSDLTVLDVNGFVCWQCEKIHDFYPDISISDDPENYEIGLKKPT
ncbi:MAG: hypothetical protein JSW11_00410 [Candidatus Heimdallarchaeota archaeon]|nr:MAG: hypothetical protein JSW11_00410 [Candidatus Heimdallarchaeota archaeon]